MEQDLLHWWYKISKEHNDSRPVYPFAFSRKAMIESRSQAFPDVNKQPSLEWYCLT